VKKTGLILLFIILALGACANAPEPKPQKTQLEIRELQTRSYDTKDVKMVMKAVMHALQDNNFIVQQADVDLGLLTAQKEVDLESSEGFSWGKALAIGAVVVAVGAAIVILGKGDRSNSNRSGSSYRHEPSFKKSPITEASANISEFGDQTRVRLNFRLKILDNKGGTAEVKQIDDPKFYQNFFSTLDKAVFLAKENLQ